jgi:hypothetical protein
MYIIVYLYFLYTYYNNIYKHNFTGIGASSCLHRPVGDRLLGKKKTDLERQKTQSLVNLWLING